VKIVQRYLAISLAVCVIGALYLSFREVALPETSRIDRTLTEGEPLQEPSDRPAFTARIEGYTYTLVPRATYAISGLVVSQHRGDARFNLDHKTDPGNIRDVCVVTCSFSWSGDLTPAFKPETASNNHLLPADPSIAEQIGAIRVGDQIRMTGLLVDYTVTQGGREIFTRRTSLTRGDTGNGACEILYVTGLSVVARGNHLPADAGRYAWYASLAALVALGIVWFVRPPLAE
jgi:hypothetical protein